MARRRQTRGRRPTEATGRCYWASLPLELTEIIFGILRDAIQAGTVTASACASVCKAWRNYFQPLVFRRLTLTMDRLFALETMVVPQQRQHVQHIWFRFERSVDPNAPCPDDLNFHAAIYQLFHLLSKWPSRAAGQPGITLELTAFSTIDPDYSMKDVVPEGLDRADLTVDSETLTALYDRPPQPMRALTAEEWEQSISVRRYHRPMDARGVEDRLLPQAPLITGLIVRRQMHINFLTPQVGRIVSYLPNLEFLTYEPRACFNNDVTASRAISDSLKAILTNLPPTFRRLQVFEDGHPLHDQGNYPMLVSDIDSSVAHTLVETIQDKRLEAIALSFAIDCRQLFSEFYRPQISQQPQDRPGWLNLTSLVLTSPSITARRCFELPGLLTAAAWAACHMPKLEVLELYYIAPKHGAIFSYVHDKEGGGSSSIARWQSTWEWTMPPAVVSAWRQAAEVHGAKELTQEESRIADCELRLSGSIISRLHTRRTAIHPITYGNMMDGRNHM
ncbi:hypothetical protein TgHK011_001541 [Trichoderma gracile]|nr:hypothetical protein TgHK011_001541 [Trichoderma gracile]